MTPSYFYEEMDSYDLEKAMSVLKPEELSPCFTLPRENKGLKEAEKFGVIKRNG